MWSRLGRGKYEVKPESIFDRWACCQLAMNTELFTTINSLNRESDSHGIDLGQAATDQCGNHEMNRLPSDDLSCRLLYGKFLGDGWRPRSPFCALNTHT